MSPSPTLPPTSLTARIERALFARRRLVLVAGDFSGAIVSAKLQELHPNTGERLDYLEVAGELERIRNRAHPQHDIPGVV